MSSRLLKSYIFEALHEAFEFPDKITKEQFRNNLPAYTQRAEVASTVAASKMTSPEYAGIVAQYLKDSKKGFAHYPLRTLQAFEDMKGHFIRDVTNHYTGKLNDEKSLKAHFSRQLSYFSEAALDEKDAAAAGHRIQHYFSLIHALINIPEVLRKIDTFQKDQKEKLETAAEAPPDAPLGRIAFANSRKDVPIEPDTKLEDDLYHKILWHFSGDKILDNASVKQIEQLISNGWYSKVFKEPRGGVVVRGMAVPKDWVKKVLNVETLPEKGKLDVDITFTPKKGGSSWSTSPEVAENFSGAVGKRPVYIYARVSDNPKKFITGPGGLYDVGGFDLYDSEKEVIGLGQIKIFRIEWGPVLRQQDTQ